MSWKPEVQTDATGKWYGNALRFETQEEAEEQVIDLAHRWTLVIGIRVVESEDPVNYEYKNGKLKGVNKWIKLPSTQTST